MCKPLLPEHLQPSDTFKPVFDPATLQIRVRVRDECEACGDMIRVGYSVPMEDWGVAVPKKFECSRLCLACYTQFADEAMIPWDETISLFLSSLVTYTKGFVSEDK